MKRHYAGIAKRMLSELESISDQMSHSNEKGRNNEAILSEFLRRHLPTRYTVSTGKVVATGGSESGQIDLIIHDRLDTAAFIDSHSWSLVPVESTYAVVSVKTSLNKTDLRDALASLESVRHLPRNAATLRFNGNLVHLSEDQVLRPRALVFAFKSEWATLDSCRASFSDLLGQIKDENRSNGVCVLDQGFITRRPYTTELFMFPEDPLMHFFVFLLKTMESRPRYGLDLTQYFAEGYGQ